MQSLTLSDVADAEAAENPPDAELVGQRLKQLVHERSFLDVEFGLTSRDHEDIVGLRKEQFAAVHVHRLEMRDDTVPDDPVVIHTERAFSPPFHKWLTDKLSDPAVTYQEGIGGREQSRMRVVTDEKNESDVRHMRYPIGQGEKRTFYPVQAACQQEQDVLRVIRTMVVRLGEEDDRFARYETNCVQSILSRTDKGGVGKHNDHDRSQGQLKGLPYRSEKCNDLPSQIDMMTPTVVLSDCPTKRTAKVTWGRNRHVLLTIFTAGNDLHWQLYGCQAYGILHWSDPTALARSLAKSGSFHYREVLSLRYLALRSRIEDQDWQERLDRSGVKATAPLVSTVMMGNILAVMAGGARNRSTKRPTKPSTTSHRYNMKKRRGRQQVSLKDLKVNRIWKTTGLIKDGRLMKQIFLGGDLQIGLICKGYTVHVVCDPDHKEAAGKTSGEAVVNDEDDEDTEDTEDIMDGMFCFHREWGKEYVVAGRFYKGKEVAALSMLTYGSRARVPWRSDEPDRANVMLLSFPAKNDLHALAAFVSAMSADGNSMLPNINVFGQGGAPDVAGTYQPTNAVLLNPETAEFGTMPCNQVVVVPRGDGHGNRNHVLQVLNARQAIVAVFLTWNLVEACYRGRAEGPPVAPPADMQEDAVLGLGYFTLEGLMQERWKEQRLQDLFQDIPRDEQRYSRFRECVHFRANLEPLPVDAIRKLPTAQGHRQLKELWVPLEDTGQRLGIRRASHLIPAALALGPGRLMGSDLRRHYLDSGEWAEFLHGEDDEVGEEDGEYEVRTQVSRHDWASLIPVNVVAGSKRALELQCLYTKAKLVGPIRDASLGHILCNSPQPMANRDMDTIPCFLRSVVMSQYGDVFRRHLKPGKKRLVLGPDTMELFVKALFMVCVLRMTGRCEMFEEYYLSQLRSRCPIPLEEDMEVFLEFMDMSVPGKRASPFLTRQYDKSFPEAIKDKAGWKQYGRNLAAKGLAGLRSLVRQIMAAEEDVRRRGAVLRLAALQGSCVTGEEGNGGDDCLFVSHACIADLETLFELPFGVVTPDSVVVGKGGRVGLELLLGRALPKVRGTSRFTWMSDFGDLGKQLLDFAQHVMVPEYLWCAGYQMAHGVWRNGVSDRDLDLVDIEHWACKLYVYLSARSGSRLLSRRPNMWKPHCHPLALTLPELKLHPCVADLARDIVRRYEALFPAGHGRRPLLAKLFLDGLDDGKESEEGPCVAV